MKWTAYYRADGEMQHEIAPAGHKHRAIFEAEKFLARMTSRVQVFWLWVEDENGEKFFIEPIENPRKDVGEPNE